MVIPPSVRVGANLMGILTGSSIGVTDGTVSKGTGLALQQNILFIVWRVSRRKNRVSGAMTGFTIHAAMAGCETEQPVLRCSIFMAITAIGFVQPGFTGSVAYICHSPVAVGAIHALLKHRAP